MGDCRKKTPAFREKKKTECCSHFAPEGGGRGGVEEKYEKPKKEQANKEESQCRQSELRRGFSSLIENIL